MNPSDGDTCRDTSSPWLWAIAILLFVFAMLPLFDNDIAKSVDPNATNQETKEKSVVTE